MTVLGLDTSNYTTSIAFLSDDGGENCSRLLPVKPGELGLRQSDAVFHHTKSLPELSGRLFSHLDGRTVSAVGVSTRPRAVEGSYMPCFLVGYSHAVMLAQCLNVPLLEVSHQQGHVAAALWSADHLELMDQPHLAWHLSGGTTELLLVEPEGKNVRCKRIGGTTDISAGQLIDRTGVLLGLPFPAGKHLDALSAQAEKQDFYPVKCTGMEFSLSGMQNQVAKFAESNTPGGYRRLCPGDHVQRRAESYPECPEGISGLADRFFRWRGFQFHAPGADEAPGPGVCPAPVFHG